MIDDEPFKVEEWVPRLESAILEWHHHDDLRVKSLKSTDSEKLGASVLRLKDALLLGRHNDVCILSSHGVSLLSPPMYEKLVRFLRTHRDEDVEDVSEVQGTACTTSNVVSFFTLEMHERARDGLVHFLRSTPCPSACPYNLLGWASIFWDDATKSILRGRISMEVWNLGFEWITYPRSNEELAQTSGGLVCTCSEDSIAVRPAHGKGEKYVANEDAKLESRPVLVLINLFLRGMANCANEKRLSLARQPRQVRKRSPWPDKFQSLLPHGPKDTLRGLLSWFRTDLEWRSRSSVTLALNVLILYHPALIIPHLVVTTEFTYCVIQRTVRFNQDFLKESQTSSDAVVMIHNVVDHMQSLIRLLDDFMMVTTAMHRRLYHEVDANNLLRAYQQMSIVCVYLVTKVPARMGGGEVGRSMHEAVARFGGLLMDDFPDVKHEHTTEMTTEAYREQTMRRRYGPVYIRWDRIYRLLRYLDCIPRCDAPKCRLLTSRSITAPHYMRCTGCARAMYCSRKCQKSAWTDGENPHRDICNNIAYFSTSVLPPKRNLPFQLPPTTVPVYLQSAAARVEAHVEDAFGFQMEEAGLTWSEINYDSKR